MPFITVTYPPKYPLTDSEKVWLIDREWTLEVMGSYSCGPCQYRDKDDLLCIFRKCPKFEPNYKDAAEFESRVAARLTGLKAEELPCYPNFLCPYSAKLIGSCKACYLKHARLAVEQEMEKEGK